MKLSPRLQVIAAMVGMHSREFSVGWANGMVRWEGRVTYRDPIGQVERYLFAENRFEPGSVKWAASEAAITFMKERER